MLSWTNATPEVGAGTILGPGHLDAHVTRRIALPDSPVIERCWRLTRDLDTALSNSTIPGLSVQLTWEEKVTRGVPGGFLLTGPTTRRFDVTLEGRGQVLGVRFLPGAFTGVTGIPAGDLTDRTRPAAGVFSLPDVPDPEDMVRAVEARGVVDERWSSALAAVRLAEMQEVTTVDALAECAGQTPRGLQRMFRHYIGLSPKTVITRLRLQDALRTLNTGPAGPAEPAESAGSLADLAVRLGFYDQAHFTREFRAFTGHSPGFYAASQRG